MEKRKEQDFMLELRFEITGLLETRLEMLDEG
jgi:hypothetical protein